MAQLNVSIAGKIYRMACADGEEQHLESLATEFDRRVSDMQEAFGQIGDLRLHVMAALTVLDELQDARKRLAEGEAEMRAVRTALAGGDQRIAAAEGQAAEALIKVSERIESLARELNPMAVSGSASVAAPAFAITPQRD